MKCPQQQAALIRKIVDHIRNSPESQVVLQTAVDEVAALLKTDGNSVGNPALESGKAPRHHTR